MVLHAQHPHHRPQQRRLRRLGRHVPDELVRPAFRRALSRRDVVHVRHFGLDIHLEGLIIRPGHRRPGASITGHPNLRLPRCKASPVTLLVGTCVDIPGRMASLTIMVGWLSSLSWTAGLASGSVLIANTFQGLIVVANPDYVPQKWQAYLFTVMIATFSLFVNTFLARWLPRQEGFFLLLFSLAFIAVVAVSWALGPRLSAGELFLHTSRGMGC
jgi:hypothetical protein